MRPDAGAKSRPAPGRFPIAPLAVVALVLLATADDRHVGGISDGRQMIRTAVAISETGELGQARGALWTAERPEGDAVSRYGMGMTFAQLPAALLAPAVERALGPATSQPLFLAAPFLSVLAAAWAAGRVACLLGASPRGEALAILLASLGSPLGAYAASEFSEALQAACLALAFAGALASGRSDDPRRSLLASAAAGFCAGFAVLTKSSLLFVAPFALLPLLSGRAGAPLRRLGAAAAGALPALGAWLAFELVRFGRPLGGYGGTSFSHPFLDGLWRLLVGPNKGLFLCFPAAAVAVWAGARALRTGAPDRRERILAAAGALLPAGALLALAAPWWAWHGVGGWGPRLLVPAVPLLAALAAPVVESWPRRAGFLLLGASVALNLPPLLQHPTPVDNYTLRCRRARVDEAFAGRLPAFAIERDAEGKPTVSPDHVLSRLPLASGFVVYPWFLSARAAGDAAAVARHLETPPWLGVRPDLGPAAVPFPLLGARILAPPFRLSFLGRGFFRAPDDLSPNAAYDEALADQVLRALQQKSLERALALAEKLETLAPGDEADALLAETYRLLRRVETASAFVGSLPPERRASPKLGLVLALFARDRGDEANARKFLDAVASAFPGTPAEAARTAPLAAWPPDLSSMTARKTFEAPVGLPSVGGRN